MIKLPGTKMMVQAPLEFCVLSRLDGDGDMDVLSASQSDDKIAWYENDGAGTFGAQQEISTSADDDKITWYENDGAGTFGAQQVISTAALGAISVYATDIDGDGDMDVLSLGDDKIAWYKNDLLEAQCDGDHLDMDFLQPGGKLCSRKCQLIHYPMLPIP
jgi:hypothetical protein